MTTEPAPAAATAYCENGASVAVASRNTIVMNASRMDSAISFGVRERLAPSTIAIMRSRNPSPSRLVTRTTSQSDSTRVPPVTEEKSPPASRSTGADSPVTALSLTEATPSTTSPSAGMIVVCFDQHEIAAPKRARLDGLELALLAPHQPLRVNVLAHRSERRRLRFAAPFGHRLCEVCEQHGQPQPCGDGEHESGMARVLDHPSRRRETDDRGEDAAHVDDEHHRIAELHTRIRASRTNRGSPPRRSAPSGNSSAARRAAH